MSMRRLEEQLKIWLYVVSFLLLEIKATAHPDINLTLEGRIKRHGYTLESHQLTTDDGYILPLYRIPNGVNPNKNYRNKSAVLLMHGLGGGPSNWVTLGAKQSLPYYLADRDFDVWMLCARGVVVPSEKKHVKLDWNKDKAFWHFSLHEIGIYDLKAGIDYVTALTNQSKVFFIGHSAGSLELFILLSERPEYNEKIKIGALYASSPIIKRIDYPLAIFLCRLAPIWRGLSRYFDLTEFFPQIRILNPIAKIACSDPLFVKTCLAIAGVVGSHMSVLMEEDLIGVMASEQPARLSFWQIFQLVDNVNEGDFRQLNHGPKTNMKLYGQEIPPRYNLSRTAAPIAFFYGQADSICLKSDIYESMNHIPNVILDYEVPFKKFTHTDFLFARNASELVYEPTYKLFRDYDEGKIPPAIGKRKIPDDDLPTVF